MSTSHSQCMFAPIYYMNLIGTVFASASKLHIKWHDLIIYNITCLFFICLPHYIAYIISFPYS